MLLSNKDITHLEKRGFSKTHFVKYDTKGYAQLKNRRGHCVFYKLKNRQCSVYTYRPLGCRIYPVILDEDLGIVLDGICRSRETITEKEKEWRGKRVVKLLLRIDCEAEKRRSRH